MAAGPLFDDGRAVREAAPQSLPNPLVRIAELAHPTELAAACSNSDGDPNLNRRIAQPQQVIALPDRFAADDAACGGGD